MGGADRDRQVRVAELGSVLVAVLTPGPVGFLTRCSSAHSRDVPALLTVGYAACHLVPRVDRLADVSGF